MPKIPVDEAGQVELPEEDLEEIEDPGDPGDPGDPDYDDDDDDAEEPEPPPPLRAVGGGKRSASPAASRPRTTAMADLDRLDELDLVEYIRTFGGDAPLRVDLYRITPAMHKGINIKGKICSYEEPITEDQIMEEHGGGRYQIRIQALNANGSYTYRKARTFHIAGLPKVDNLVGVERDAPEPVEPLSDGSSESAFRMAEMMITAANRRAERAEERGGTDWAMITALIKPLEAQVQALSDQLKSKDQTINELMSKPADTRSEDRLFDLMGNKDQQYANALNQIRTQHDSELRQLREYHRDEMKRVESRLAKEIEHARESARREVEALKDAHKQSLENQRLGYENRIVALNEVIDRYKGDVTEKRAELAELRSKKDLSLFDQITQIGTLKTALDDLSPNTESEESPWMGIARSILGSPKTAQVANRVMTAVGAGDEAGDPLVEVMTPDGQRMRLPRSYVQQLEAQRAAAAMQQQAEAGAGAEAPGPDMTGIDASEVARAVGFIENAIRNQTDPRIFAVSAQGMIPEPILAFLAEHGVDAFFTQVAKLDPGSPIRSVAGRKFVRAVANHLLGNTTEGTQEDPSSPVDS